MTMVRIIDDPEMNVLEKYEILLLTCDAGSKNKITKFSGVWTFRNSSGLPLCGVLGYNVKGAIQELRGKRYSYYRFQVKNSEESVYIFRRN